MRTLVRYTKTHIQSADNYVRPGPHHWANNIIYKQVWTSCTPEKPCYHFNTKSICRQRIYWRRSEVNRLTAFTVGQFHWGGNRPPLPSVILCNASILWNKMEELHANRRHCVQAERTYSSMKDRGQAMLFLKKIHFPNNNPHVAGG